MRGLGEETRRLILERVKPKLGFTKTPEALSIAKGSLHNYLQGIKRVLDNVVHKALQYLEEGEFNGIIKRVDKLQATGIIRGD